MTDAAGYPATTRRYRIEYVESSRRMAIVEAESESAAREAFEDGDIDDDWELDSGPTEVIGVRPIRRRTRTHD